MKYWLTFLQVLNVFDEPLGELDIERHVKHQPVPQKKAPNNILQAKNCCKQDKVLCQPKTSANKESPANRKGRAIKSKLLKVEIPCGIGTNAKDASMQTFRLKSVVVPML